MAELTMAQKKDWAKTLYLKENLPQQEIAERVGISRQTICRWVADGKWDMLKVSITITKEEQLNNLYRQLAELNNAISERKPEDGKKFATPSEADTIGKLAKAIKQLETEVGLADVTSVFSGFLKWLRVSDPKYVKEISSVLDSFIKSKLA